MPVTLQNLLDDRTLGLRCLNPPAEPEREIDWVHSSELADPTRYLDGGELLLTTGIGPDAAGPGRYADRLADHGLAGIGFGTGLGHDEVPPELVAACARRGLGLLEIPERTPFIALSKAVSAALAADAYARVVRTDEAQRALTAAALGRSGTRQVLRGLADRLSAWALVSDTDGTVRHAVPRAAAARGTGLQREVRRVREHRGPVSVSLDAGDGQVVLHALPGDAVVVLGRDSPFTAVDRQVIGSAVSLLTLLHSRTSAVGQAERRLRTALLRTAVEAGGGQVRDIAADLWGPLPAGPLRVVVLHRRSGGAARLVGSLEAAAGRGGPQLFGELDDVVVVLAGADDVAAVVDPLSMRGGVRVGVSEPVADADLAAGLRQARRSADAAARLGRAVVWFAELAGEGLRGLVPQHDAAAFAEAALAPLAGHGGRADLVGSLREWLAHHGQWDPAAARLGVHRHTLRARIDKIGALLGRDLDSPGVRADLWFALQSLEPSPGPSAVAVRRRDG